MVAFSGVCVVYQVYLWDQKEATANPEVDQHSAFVRLAELDDSTAQLLASSSAAEDCAVALFFDRCSLPRPVVV